MPDAPTTRLMADTLALLDGDTPASALPNVCAPLTPEAMAQLIRIAQAEDTASLPGFRRALRIHTALHALTGDANHLEDCFGLICRRFIWENGGLPLRREARFLRDAHIRLPARVNWGGGWTDTPPYCLEYGGTVLNTAITLKGLPPIEADVMRIPGEGVLFSNADEGVCRRVTDLAELQDFRDLSDPFALHKAALIVCGVLPETGELPCTLSQRLGGGICLNTRALGIPKGSGLGTSSILASACVKAILTALGESPEDEEVIRRVLCMEQLLGTGGGWQDPAAGLSGGMQLLRTEKGFIQHIQREPIALSPAARESLTRRFALIYTGHPRLARERLQEVMLRYLQRDPHAGAALSAISVLAEQMKTALEADDLPRFAALLNAHWAQCRHIDPACTNPCVEAIFAAIADLIDGRMICGAGGGGFLQVLLKEGVSRDKLRIRLNESFPGHGVEVWDCELG